MSDESIEPVVKNLQEIESSLKALLSQQRFFGTRKAKQNESTLQLRTNSGARCRQT